jgi:diguanylate cyclase (GGDEF)-like protein/PAS domain S-box-containing protein
MTGGRGISIFKGHRLATFSYVVALTLIASFSIGTHVLIDTIVHAQEATGKVVNIAGRQRMLSQRIASLSLEISQTPWSERRERLLVDLGEAVALMERSYRALRLGDPQLDMPSADSPRLRRIYDEEPTNLAIRLDTFLGHARAFLATAALGDPDPGALDAVRAAARRSLLQSLDAAVVAYQADSEDAIDRLRNILFGVLGGMLTTLVAEALLIFRPLFRRLADRELRLVELAADLDQALTLSTAELRLAGNIIQHTAEGILVISAEGKILSVNPAFCAITGYIRSQVLGQPMQIMRTVQQPGAVYDAVWDTVREQGSWSGELWLRRQSGEGFLAMLTVNPLSIELADTGAAFVAIFADITEMRQKDATIEHMSFHDTLTGLPNRDMLWDLLGQMVRRALDDGGVRAVVSLDFDRFKVVNDSLGHAIGDAVLRQAAARISNQIGDADVVARIGADEFVVLLEGLQSPEEYALVVEQLIVDLSRCYTVGGKEARLGVSAGIALCLGNDAGSADLLRQAGNARMLAKQKGGGYQFYRPDLDEAICRRLRVETALREAVEGERFYLDFQPKIDLGSGEMRGMEALLRWRHAEFGMVSPAVFIPMAEEIGVIHKIGDWVLRECCAQAIRFRDEGLRASIAANVSALQLLRGDLPDRVAALLEETGVDPALLQLELTESSIIQEPEATTAQLARLRAMGVRVALDDFGTGYSSLSYLRTLPIDYVKIDRSFVMHLETNETDVTVARSIITLGHALGLKIIAEGIETEGQAAILKSMGCDIGQGYLYARPLSPAQLSAWCAQHPPGRSLRIVT